MQDHSYYIFVSGDVFSEDAIIAAPTAIAERLETRFWPLNERTSYLKRLVQGDKVVLYAAGRKNNIFVGTVLLDSSSVSLSREERLKAQWKYDYVLGAEHGVWLKQPVIFKDPVAVRPILGKLSFVGASPKWGIYFRSPIIRISKADFDLIMSAAGIDNE